MMFKNPGIWRCIAIIAGILLSLTIVVAMVCETYRIPLDTIAKTKSQDIVTEITDDEDEIWNYESNFKSAREAYEGFKEFAIRESQETVALLKNKGNALPISKDAKISLLGVRSYAPVYSNSAGSNVDGNSTRGHEIFDAFANRGFKVNPSLLATYASYFEDKNWTTSRFTGTVTPEYADITKYTEVVEFTPDELAALSASYNSEYATYNDAAIVVVGRPGGEGAAGYYPGADRLTNGTTTTTGNILGLTSEEKEVIAHAKANFDKVIVLINSVSQMELGEIEGDDGIDAIVWVGFPGSYGFYGVADVLNGTVSPSAHLGDIYAKNTVLNPAMMNYGNIPWTNVGDFAGTDNVNSYLIQAEGIYAGYRYYETRYADIVNKTGNASAAKAGTYANADGSAATVDGTWNYANEVIYPFGYGLSYATFKQTLDNVSIMGNKKTASVTVSVENTGTTYSGKSVIQLYAQSPYTEYDKINKVEKSAIQLIDFEKTETLAPGQKKSITMEVDLANLASYDYVNAKTYILDPGDYYFAIGTDSHDALNNILAKQGKTTGDGMTGAGDSTKAYTWNWGGDVDSVTFSMSKARVEITNAVSSGDSSMDINTFIPNTVTYLSRSDWNATYPITHSGLTANAALTRLLKNDFIELKTNEDTSDIIFGAESDLTLNDMKGADFDDDRWDELINKTTVQEFMDFAQRAFHNIQEIPSIGYIGHLADDGPNGADTHSLDEGRYRGVDWTDGEDYKGFATRVCPSPTNLAYSFNKELAYENGEIVLGESSLIFELPIMIGPGMNIHRHAYNPRGSEYYSEDPILSGFIGSAVVQGAQSKGCIVNIKHSGFNDQEINRSGIAVFMNEQKARELELRNLQQAFEGNGLPASFRAEGKTYGEGALGVMTSYNRIGATASSANYGVMVQIMREEWGFKGYNVTDFTGVSPKAAPKESILYGTTAFCGMGSPSVSYWNAAAFSGDRAMLLAIKQNMKYNAYVLANSNAMNGINSTSRAVWLMTWWRGLYIAFIIVFSVIITACAVLYVLGEVKRRKEVK